MSFGNGYNGGRTRMTTKVLLNVYDLSPTNDYLYPVGMGLHHSGVEISGREYSYSDQGGIYDGPPRQAPNARFRCQIDMGTFDGGTQELNKALDELRHNSGFGSNGYNLIRKNCNHFCNALVWQLLRKPIPAHVNRLANIGDCCSCLLPKEMLSSNSPVGTTGGSDNQPSSSFGSAPYRSPMNRGTTGSGVSAFAGTGYSLNGGCSASSSSSSSTSTSLGAQPDLTDRREKARKAALARLEQQKQNQE